MKLKSLAAFIAIAFALSCGNSTPADESVPNTPGAQNANGNILDTSQGTNLNAPLPIDSSKIKDSMNRQR